MPAIVYQPSLTLLVAGTDYVAFDNMPWRHFRVFSVSPSTANVQVRPREAGRNGTYFPISTTNPSRIDRDIDVVPFIALDFKTDTPNTTIEFSVGLTDIYLVDPAAAGSSASSILIEGADATTGTPTALVAGSLGGSTGYPGDVLVTQQYNTTNSSNFSAASGGTVTNTPKEAVGKTKISFTPSATTGLGLATPVQVNGQDPSGTRGIPVYDQNGFLISSIGQISAANITAQTTPAAAQGIADFYIDAATFSGIQAVVPVFTGVATMNVSIVSGPEVSSVVLKPYPAPTPTAPAESGIFAGQTLQFAPVNVSIAASGVLVAAVSGKRVYLVGYQGETTGTAAANSTPTFTATTAGTTLALIGSTGGSANLAQPLVNNAPGGALPYLAVTAVGDGITWNNPLTGPHTSIVAAFYQF